MQTAALLGAYFPRANLVRSEVATLERWVDAYRSLLDAWVAWVPRCSLDVAMLEQRRALGGQVALPDAVQTVVLCPVCNVQLTQQAVELLNRKNALRGSIRSPTVRVSAIIWYQCSRLTSSDNNMHVLPERTSALLRLSPACHAHHRLGAESPGHDGQRFRQLPDMQARR